MTNKNIQFSNNKKYDQPLQDYGRIAKEYLKEKQPVRYTTLVMEGTLMEYLHKIEDQSIDHEIQLEKQILNQRPYPKTENPLVKEAHLKVIQSLAREQVTAEMLKMIDNN
ncbi:TnpV protein [Enterococcus wangshanyuanii]|uniref:TnpV protein n=1 Tax=Enterococcus wangshanyuanii TaxID=2005703 RepID=UPI000B4BDB79